MADDIIGHRRIIDFFEKAIANGRVSHAYCFIGREHIGKLTVAHEIIGKLLDVGREKIAGHPDVLTVAQEVNEKTDAMRRDITIEQIQEMRMMFSEHSFLGGYRAVIIDGAERMSASAANALLKTLEEPRGNSILILLTEDEEELPATIVSRCQRIYFESVSEQDICDDLIQRGIEPATARSIAESSCGLPGLALLLASSDDARREREKERERFASLAGKAFFEKLAIVEPLFGDKIDRVAARDALRDTLLLWEMWNGKQILDAVKCGMDSARGLAVHAAIREARSLLLENIHPRLLMEHILLAV